MHCTKWDHHKSLFILALACAAGGAIGCYRAGDTTVASHPNAATAVAPAPLTRPAGPSSAPSPTTIIFDDKKDGVRLQFTSAWVSRPDPDYVLQLVPADGSTGRRIIFDIPDLPFHIPGMIQPGLVEHGYLSDLKEKHKDLRVESSAACPIGRGAQARLVISSWTQDGGPHHNVALLIIRSDHVFILACGSDPAHLAATRTDFDAVAESLHWTK